MYQPNYGMNYGMNNGMNGGTGGRLTAALAAKIANGVLILAGVMMLVGSVGMMPSLGTFYSLLNDGSSYYSTSLTGEEVLGIFSALQGFSVVMRIGVIMGLVAAIAVIVIRVLNKNIPNIPIASGVIALAGLVLHITLYMYSSIMSYGLYGVSAFANISGSKNQIEAMSNDIVGAQVRSGIIIGLSAALIILAIVDFRSDPNKKRLNPYAYNNGYPQQYPQQQFSQQQYPQQQYPQQQYPQNPQVQQYPQQTYPQGQPYPQQSYPQAPQVQAYPQQTYPQTPQAQPYPTYPQNQQAQPYSQDPQEHQNTQNPNGF